jgi:hypothetical protein
VVTPGTCAAISLRERWRRPGLTLPPNCETSPPLFRPPNSPTIESVEPDCLYVEFILPRPEHVVDADLERGERVRHVDRAWHPAVRVNNGPTGVGGTVLLEFVVRADGRIYSGSVKVIIETPHEELASTVQLFHPGIGTWMGHAALLAATYAGPPPRPRR